MSTMTAVSAPIRGDVDLAAVGSVLADRARCRMVLALNDGRALPASALASEAGVAASTASSHLGRLVDAGLITVAARGRHRYYRLAGPHVAELIEAIGRLAPAEPVRSLKQGTRAYHLRRARTCYDHLAGRLGVAVAEQMVARGALAALPSPGGDLLVGHGSPNGASDQAGYTLEPAGSRLLQDIGVTLDAGSLVRCCVDWTEQRHHLAGAHGRAILGQLFALEWIRRSEKGRAVQVTDRGRNGLTEWVGLPPTAFA